MLSGFLDHRMSQSLYFAMDLDAFSDLIWRWIYFGVHLPKTHIVSGIWKELSSLLFYRNKSSFVLDFLRLRYIVTHMPPQVDLEESRRIELLIVIQQIYRWKQEVVTKWQISALLILFTNNYSLCTRFQGLGGICMERWRGQFLPLMYSLTF